MLKEYIKDYALLILIAGSVVLLDQITKYIVRINLPLGQVYHPELWLSQYIRIVHWKNTGAAFGIFQNMGGVFTILSFVVAIVIFIYYPQVPRKDWPVRIAMGLLLGGATGNLIDRLARGYVTDFVSVGSFPVFNVADASISTGVVILFIGMWLQEREAKSQESRLEEAEEPAIQESTSARLPEELQGE